MKELVRIKSFTFGPRWERMDCLIKNLCWLYNLKYKIERETHLLRETVRYEIEGESTMVEYFQKDLKRLVNERNFGL